MNTEKKFSSELTISDWDEVIKSIEAGNMSGIIDSGADEDLPSYRIAWDLSVDKFEN